MPTSYTVFNVHPFYFYALDLTIPSILHVFSFPFVHNTVSLPVVCAAELAAITCKQLRRERMANAKYVLKNARLANKYDSAKGRVLAERGDLFGTTQPTNGTNAIDAFKAAFSIADEAFACSVLCTCESSGQTTKAEKIVECTNCGVSICLDCCDRCRTSSHDLHQVKLASRNDYRVFERTLRSTFPSTLQLGKGCEDLLRDGEGLESKVDTRPSFTLSSATCRPFPWSSVAA